MFGASVNSVDTNGASETPFWGQGLYRNQSDYSAGTRDKPISPRVTARFDFTVAPTIAVQHAIIPYEIPFPFGVCAAILTQCRRCKPRVDLTQFL